MFSYRSRGPSCTALMNDTLILPSLLLPCQSPTPESCHRDDAGAPGWARAPGPDSPQCHVPSQQLSVLSLWISSTVVALPRGEEGSGAPEGMIFPRAALYWIIPLCVVQLGELELSCLPAICDSSVKKSRGESHCPSEIKVSIFNVRFLSQ